MELNQVTVTVDNFEAGIEFYQSLGLKLIVHTPPKGYARFEFPRGGATLSIHVGQRPINGGPKLYFEVDDVDREYERLTDIGLTFDTHPVDQTWCWREAWLSDPAGNKLCLFYAGPNRRFPPWRIENP